MAYPEWGIAEREKLSLQGIEDGSKMSCGKLRSVVNSFTEKLPLIR